MPRFKLGFLVLVFIVWEIGGFYSSGQDQGWQKRVQELQEALRKENTELAKVAIEAVARDDSKRAAEVLLRIYTSNLKAAKDVDIHFHIVHQLGSFKDKEAIQCIKNLILDTRVESGLRRDLFISLKLNNSDESNNALLEILKRGETSFKLFAITELEKRKKKEFISPLIEVLKSGRESELEKRSVETLRLITKQTLKTYEEWQRWWDKNKDTFEVGKDDERTSSGALKTGVLVKVVGTEEKIIEEITHQEEDEIVVIEGKFDAVQKVLSEIRIPHKVIKKNEFQTYDLKNTSVVLMNCDDMQEERDRLRNRDIEKIRDFVKKGGYLFTSDWILKYVLEIAFPGVIKSPNITGDVEEVENIYPKTGMSGHPLLKDVFLKFKGEKPDPSQIEHRMDFRWKIHKQSFLIDYDPKKVTVLVESPGLGKDYKYPAVVVTFLVDETGRVDPGGVYDDISKLKGGRVLHVLGHFKDQLDTKWDEFVLQTLLLNFIIEKKKRDSIAKAKKK